MKRFAGQHFHFYTVPGVREREGADVSVKREYSRAFDPLVHYIVLSRTREARGNKARGRKEGRTWNETDRSKTVGELFPGGSYFRKL